MSSYRPNVPSLVVTDVVEVPDIAKVLLAEFADSAPLCEVVTDPTSPATEERDAPEDEESPVQTRPLATASGLRLHRVIAPHFESVVTQYDASTDRTPIDFLEPSGAVLASTHPGEEYSWQITLLGRPTGLVAPILGNRMATPDECSALDKMYPGWLAACSSLDDSAKEQGRISGLVSSAQPLLPPPHLGADVNDRDDSAVV